VAFLETLSPSGISELTPFSATYSTFLNDQAGIVDDTIITNITETSPASPPTFHVVTNAANHDNNVAYFTEELAKFKKNNPDVVVDWEVIPNTGLIALQGPKAATILQSLNPTSKDGKFDLSTLTFSHSAWLSLHDSNGSEILPHPVLVSRTGYTGEDGFEISIPNPDPSSDVNPTLVLTEKLLSSPDCKLAGLAARDALRLEAGLCLHGTDIDAATTPLEAGLVWIIPKSRRSPDAGFNGAATLYGDDAKPIARKRVGIMLDGKVVARHGSTVKSATGEEVGEVTSGGPSPCMDSKPIAMAMVKRKDGPKINEEVKLVVRGKERIGKVVKMPFVATKYYK
jgi:aminomethyltransferase